jgi:bacterioferritin
MDVKSTKPVIEALNAILTGELTAVNQYFLHARMCGNWGFKKLEAKIYAESIDEMRHADMLIERILYLDGVPNVQRLGRVRIGEDVKEILESDLSVELEAIPRLKESIELCHAEHDHGTRTLLERILESEEEHLDWLETQLHVIATIGIERYLSEQIGADED